MLPQKRKLRVAFLCLMVGLTAFVLGRTLGRDREPASPPSPQSQTFEAELVRQPPVSQQPLVTSQNTTPSEPSQLPSPQRSTAPENSGEPKWGVTVVDGRLSVRVQNRSLKRLLEEIADKSNVPIIVSTGVEDQRVSMQFENLPFDQGLQILFQALDTFFSFGVQGQASAALRAVWVYPPGKGHRVVPVPPEAWASTAEMSEQLSDPEPEKRAPAVEVLIERQGKRALETVLQALEDGDEKVRYRTLYKAVNSGLTLSNALLEHLLVSDPSPVVRFLALDAIANVSGAQPESLRAIAELALHDPHVAIQSQAQEILDTLEAANRPAETTEPQPGQEDDVSR